jgi:hypothetical protein
LAFGTQFALYEDEGCYNVRLRIRLFQAIVLSTSVAGVFPLAAQQSYPAEISPDGWRKFGNSAPAAQPAAPPVAAPSVTSPLILPAGSFVNVRVDQPLSSDHNAPGDVFSGTLTQPLVVNGYVVARRGQTLSGRVAEAKKAGRTQGQSSLGVELTQISLVDGQQVPVHTQLIQYSGGTSRGRDASAIAATTGTGAAIGAMAAGGLGAGIGAAAGAVASTIGVLVTRGLPTEIYPEATLTFRTLQAVTIDTQRSAAAFRPVTQRDYETRLVQRTPVVRAPAPGYYAGWGYPYASPYFYSPYYYGFGPSFYYSTRPYYYARPYYYRGHR